jgi:catechol 2,3-dioxygenase-like lactoylglutathione lyase family enzyme
MPEQPRHCIVAIVPCNDIEASTAFYVRLGLSGHADHGHYRILSDGRGWLIHLSAESHEGWVVRLFAVEIRTAFISTLKMSMDLPPA